MFLRTIEIGLGLDVVYTNLTSFLSLGAVAVKDAQILLGREN